MKGPISVSGLCVTVTVFLILCQDVFCLSSPVDSKKFQLKKSPSAIQIEKKILPIAGLEDLSKSKNTNTNEKEVVGENRMIHVSGGGKTSTSPMMNILDQYKSTLTLGGYFGLWYFLNIYYNIYNKNALNQVSMPWTIAFVQMFMGVVYVVPLWLTGLRKAPVLNMENVKNVSPIAAMHALAHVTAVISLGAGAVSFTHIVKAAEPAFTALFSAIFLKQFFAAPVYLTLIPVMGGVAIASRKENSFSWLSFGCAMAANVCCAMRGILAKVSMGAPKGENMNAANLYGVLTILATIMLAPIAAVMEGPVAKSLFDKAVASGASAKDIIYNMVMSGLTFYLYNEVAFMTLDKVHPVTHAVGNTIKRVVIIGASIIVFKNEVTTQGYIGSAIAIGGVLLYSLAQDYYKGK